MLLPYIEERNLYQYVDLRRSCEDVRFLDGGAFSATRIATYLCPSETKADVRMEGGEPRHFPLSYGYNAGVWFVYDPKTGSGGLGAFYPWSRLAPRDFRDGMSTTLAFSEVKAYEPYFRNLRNARPIPIPIAPDDVCNLGYAEFWPQEGHTEWAKGRCHQTGFTSVFTPNTRVLCLYGGTVYDVNWTNHQEGLPPDVPTFAAVISRSHHPDQVSTLLMDGSVRSVSNTVSLEVWQALSTRAGNEPVSAVP
jgi:hypothetical protein